MLEEAHGICAVAMPAIKIQYGAIRLRAIDTYAKIATYRVNLIAIIQRKNERCSRFFNVIKTPVNSPKLVC